MSSRPTGHARPSPLVALALALVAAGAAGAVPATAGAVRISSPPPGRVASGTVPLAARVAHPGDVAQVRFYVDGTLVRVDRASPFRGGAWATPSVADGVHTVRVVAVRRSGIRTTARRAVVVANHAGTDAGTARWRRADTTPPSTPAGVTVGPVTTTSVAISWSASTDDRGVAGYGVYRDGTRIATTSSTSSVVSGLACGFTYRVGVDAYDAGGNRSGIADVMAATAACAPAVSPPPPTSPPPTSPPPDVAASVFVAPAGSDAAPCTQGAPCLSLDRAYHAALPGQVVEVAAGTYPTQAIQPDPTKTSPDDVVIRPAAGAQVATGELQVYARHLEIRDLTASGIYAKAGSDDVTFRRITDTAGLYVASASNISVIGGSVGPGLDYHSQIQAAYLSTVPPTNILVDGVTFHDWRRSASGIHTECLQILSGDGVTIRNSRFTRCDVMDIHVSTYGAAPETRNVTIENNFLDTTGSGGYYAINSGTFGNLVIRDNSALQPIVVDPTRGTGSNIRVVANVAPMSPGACQAAVTYAHNVWDGTTCSPTDVDAPPGFVDPATLDLHLAPGSAAIDRGDPVLSTPTDIDGQPRGALPDAGADEIG